MDRFNDKYILSLDIGGTYIKCGLYDIYGNQASLGKRYNHPICEKSGYVEYDPDELWEISRSCIQDAISQKGAKGTDIVAIGISAQGSGCYFLGEGGNVIRNFIASSDTRAQSITEKWRESGLEKAMYPYIYRCSSAGHTNAILAWLRDNEPETYRKIRWNFSMKDYLIYKMTGNIVAGRGCMSCTGLMNQQTQTFDAELIKKQGLGEMADTFGEMVWDTQCCGGLTEKAAEACGCAAGTPVAAGSHDVISTAFSMGCVDESHIFVIMGTCSINGYISPKPILDGSIRFNEIFATPGHYLIEQPGCASSGVLEWVIDLFFDRKDENINDIYGKINEMVASVDPRDSDLIFVPYLRGHYDNMLTRGTWIGLTPEHTRRHMLSAVYEGVVFAHMSEIEKLLKNRERPASIRLGGGATNSSAWVQMFADVTGLAVEIVPKEETTAKGAAIVASVAAGIYPNVDVAISNMTRPCVTVYPRKEYTEVYRLKYDAYRNVLSNLDSVWTEFRRSV